MFSSEFVTLIAAALALTGSVVSLFISTRLALWRERRHLLWSKELDRFLELEELAGQLVEFMGSYRPVPDDKSVLSADLNRLAVNAGRFARYPGVRQAIRDLHNVLNRQFEFRDGKSDETEVRKKLNPAYLALLDECDKVLDRKSSNYA